MVQLHRYNMEKNIEILNYPSKYFNFIGIHGEE